MNTIAKRVTGLVTRSSHSQLQQERGIRVKVFSGDLDKALTILQRKMQSSGMERLIKAQQTHHIKNSEKKVLARKNLERKIKSIDFARKLQSILIKKVRYNTHACSLKNIHCRNLRLEHCCRISCVAIIGFNRFVMCNGFSHVLSLQRFMRAEPKRRCCYNHSSSFFTLHFRGMNLDQS
ncbi:hypothetical protein DY000_02025318 [Brassica cretica]|uniref:30S ribosomal protein S21 n=1 Tax=Brassica cretica TaxID=69181 RepID=A0ABQ7E3E9_BRACR|nr:hypothetical protein DY000_02025318 [Brassica cretica]